MSYGDIYYDPPKYGLSVVGEIDDPNASYSFDLTVAWADTETGKVYWATDSGCSCPSPFESMGRGDLNPLPETWDELLAATQGREGYDSRPFYNAADVSEFLRKVNAAILEAPR